MCRLKLKMIICMIYTCILLNPSLHLCGDIMYVCVCASKPLVHGARIIPANATCIRLLLDNPAPIIEKKKLKSLVLNSNVHS